MSMTHMKIYIKIQSLLTSCRILLSDSTSLEWLNGESPSKGESATTAVGDIAPSERLEFCETGKVESSEVLLRYSSCCLLNRSSFSLSAWRLCRMRSATSELSGSFSRPIWNLTSPEVFLRTEAAYACVTPTKDFPSTSIIWSFTWIRPSRAAAPFSVMVLTKMPSFSKPESAPTPLKKHWKWIWMELQSAYLHSNNTKSKSLTTLH